MRRTTILAASTLAASILLTGCEKPQERTVAQPAPSPHTVKQTYPGRETQPQPVRFPFPDCGDGTPPCVTYDDGDEGPGMYLVNRYEPFWAILLPTCDVEDYPNNMPCILKHQDPQDRWITLRKPQ